MQAPAIELRLPEASPVVAACLSRGYDQRLAIAQFIHPQIVVGHRAIKVDGVSNGKFVIISTDLQAKSAFNDKKNFDPSVLVRF
jgi:hypothetical protein